MPINAIFERDGDVLRPFEFTAEAVETLGDPPALERGSTFAWEVVEHGTAEAFADVTTERIERGTPIRSELDIPSGDFTAASTACDDFDDVDGAAPKVLVSNAEAALAHTEP